MCKLVLNKYSPDKKDFSILLSFLVWLFIGFLIFFVGVNNIFAATYTVDNFTAQIYDNVNGTLTAKNTYKETDLYYSVNVNYVANSSGGAWGISSPIPLVANHTYSMTVDPQVIGCGFTNLSTVNRLGVGTSLANAVTSYQNNTNVNEKFSKAISNSRYLQFVFTPTINASYIVFPFSTTSSCSGNESQLSNIVIEDLGESGLSQDDINNSLNNQTNDINNSIQNSTDTITGEIDDMEQSIIDSNKETQDVIKDQFNTCRDSYNLLNVPSELNVTTYTNINTDIKNGTYKITLKSINTNAVSNAILFQFFNNDTLITGKYFYLNSSQDTITLTSDVNVVRIYSGGSYNESLNKTATITNLMISKNGGDYEPYGEEICSNKIDETNDKLDNLQGALTDSSLPDTSGYGDVAGWLPAGTIDSLINLPLTLLTSINNNAKKSCSPYNLPFINNTTIQIPCIGDYLSNLNGWGSLINIIDLCVSGFFLYKLLMSLYKQIQKLFDLNNSDANLGGIE